MTHSERNNYMQHKTKNLPTKVKCKIILTKAFPINISIEKDKHIQKEVVLVHIRGIENKRQSNTHLKYLPGARTSRRWRRAAFRRAGGQNRVEWGPSSLPSLASASRPRSGRSKKCMLVTCYPLEQRTLNEPTSRPRFDPPHTHTHFCFKMFPKIYLIFRTTSNKVLTSWIAYDAHFVKYTFQQEMFVIMARTSFLK